MKKFSLLVVFITTSIIFLAGRMGCQTNPAGNQSKLYPGKVTIGTVTWPGYLAFYVARDKGYFKEEGLDVAIKRYTSQAEVSRDYVAGKLQGRANLSNEAINEALQGLKHKIILVIDSSNGSDGIASGPDIKNLNQARGKKVAYEHGTLEEYFLLYALEQNRMSIKDVTGVDLDPEESAKALVDGKVDVAVTYEPYLSETIEKIKGNKIYSSADAPGLITDILTFRNDFIEAHPETVAAIARVYFKAVKFWKENPDEANAINAKEHGITKEEIAQQLQGITMFDKNDNKTALTYAAGAQSLYGNLRRVSDFVLTKQGKKDLNLDTDQLIDKRFLKDLTKD